MQASPQATPSTCIPPTVTLCFNSGQVCVVITFIREYCAADDPPANNTAEHRGGEQLLPFFSNSAKPIQWQSHFISDWYIYVNVTVISLGIWHWGDLGSWLYAGREKYPKASIAVLKTACCSYTVEQRMFSALFLTFSTLNEWTLPIL